MNQLELRDIHLPDASLWWPPAPGWWMLALLVIVIAMIPWWLRWLKRKSLRRESLQALKRIQQNFDAGQGDKATLAELSALLRRILISYRGREDHAGSTGDSWFAQVTSLSPQHGFSQAQLALLTRDRYQREFEGDIESLLQTCESWIQSLPRGQTYVSN